MKQKDIALIVVIIIVSAVMSLLLSNQLISSPKNRNQEAEVVKPISAQFTQPDQRYFNKDAFNPTRVIQIGQDNNPDPFRGGSDQ